MNFDRLDKLLYESTKSPNSTLVKARYLTALDNNYPLIRAEVSKLQAELDDYHKLTAETNAVRFREQAEWRRIQAELVSYKASEQAWKRRHDGRCEQLAKFEAERDQAREREAELRRLLEISFPYVESHAIAEHMLDGFRPQIRPLDKVVEEIRQVLFTQETK